MGEEQRSNSGKLGLVDTIHTYTAWAFCFLSHACFLVAAYCWLMPGMAWHDRRRLAEGVGVEEWQQKVRRDWPIQYRDGSSGHRSNHLAKGFFLSAVFFMLAFWVSAYAKRSAMFERMQRAQSTPTLCELTCVPQ